MLPKRKWTSTLRNLPNTVLLMRLPSDNAARVAVTVIAVISAASVTVLVLVSFTAINIMHAFNHIKDMSIGGRPSDPYVIGAQALLAGIGAALRARHLRQPERSGTT
jgi:hypothetical protein